VQVGEGKIRQFRYCVGWLRWRRCTGYEGFTVCRSLSRLLGEKQNAGIKTGQNADQEQTEVADNPQDRGNIYLAA